MKTTKISFSIPRLLLESTIFVAVAFFAGSDRFIRYFPKATRGGLIMTATLSALACIVHDYGYDGKNFKISKKLIAIFSGSLISLGLTQFFKKRVSLNFYSNCKITFFGGVAVLAKNIYEYSHDENLEDPKPKSDDKLSKTAVIDHDVRKPADKSVMIRVPKGTATFNDYHRNTTEKIELVENIYDCRYEGKPALLMTEEDFKTLDSHFHPGAFGSSYRNIRRQEASRYLSKEQQSEAKAETYSLVWKLPADLKEIETFALDTTMPYQDVPVGKYLLLSDSRSAHLREEDKKILDSLQSRFGEKMRTDFSDRQLISVHHLMIRPELRDARDDPVAGISTSFFFKNFDAPKQTEKKRVDDFLDDLVGQGFGAYLCNSCHHMVVIASYTGNRITPKQLAERLDADEALKNFFIGALGRAATPKMQQKAFHWMEAFIKRFCGAANG
ncbi:MAG: hypothetical protein AAGE99_00255 [Chlamydiota bacterium]